MRGALARAIRSPLSHVSQVLGGSSNLTFEQAEDTNAFLGHSSDQAEYFLLLVQLARAGTPRLRERVQGQIDQIRQKRLVLKDRLEVKATLSREDQALFYSSWLFAAVHILMTIPEFQTVDAICRRLGISAGRGREILDFMVRLGLAELKSGKYVVGTTRIHLGNDSPMIGKHHVNWRMKAIQSLESEKFGDDLHYSSVVSLSATDVIEIKSMLVKAIESAKRTIRDSKEEKLYSFCMDFFEV